MIVLVRHGQTAVNAAGRLQGRLNVPLTDLGRRQAAAAGAALASLPVRRLVSSPLLRAQETARGLALGDLEVEVDARWIELDYGEWDGAVLRSMPTADWDRWRADPSFAPPGGESLRDLGQRVRAACDDLAAAAQDDVIVVVSHVSPIKAAVAWALDAGPEASWRMFLDVAAICRIGVSARGALLTSYNETAHLAAVPSAP